jgi:solute:Na+ symporter, SSS family
METLAQTNSELTTIIAITMIVYVIVMFIMSYIASRRVQDVEDYVVAGRRLPLLLAMPTILATWFCGGTLLTIADEVRAEGLEAAALDPLGAGVCLILAGLFFAGPLWKMKLTTLPDFFRHRFGQRAEIASAALMIPTYFGWIAAQFVALAGVLYIFFGLDMTVGIVLVAVIGTGYTLMGGMWAVTMTDALQVVLMIVGLLVLAYVTMDLLGDGSLAGGLSAVATQTPAERLVLLPTESLVALTGWLGVFSAGALGNLAGQDLMQRVFSSRSASVARTACILAGLLYITLGMLPLLLGLAGELLLPAEKAKATLPMLAKLFLNPFLAVIFVVTIFSAVLSTIDSAILAPATVLSQNLVQKVKQVSIEPLKLTRLAVVFVAIISLIVAFMGESAYSLLETSYELGMVSLLTPLALGLFLQRRCERAALVSMIAGTAVWTAHLVIGAEGFFGLELLPMGLGSMGTAIIAYLLTLQARRPQASA